MCPILDSVHFMNSYSLSWILGSQFYAGLTEFKIVNVSDDKDYRSNPTRANQT